ncbi:MAG TPA: hypothetical protein H9836_11690 [Candidatus Nocardiopsis merdipullorum]|nr:hypothetical protein [Candidatus Nocardiopsis merdipullorum]
MRNVITAVSFVAFVLVFVVSRDATRGFLESWVELEGLALWIGSFVASLALAGLAAGAVLQIGKLFDHG